MALLYPDAHPYGRRTKGTSRSSKRLTRERLAALHRARFAPSELTAVVVGDVEPARAATWPRASFGGWRPPAPPADRRRRARPPPTAGAS